MMSEAPELRVQVLAWLLETDPHAKSAGVPAMAHAFAGGALELDSAATLHTEGAIPDGCKPSPRAIRATR